MKQNIVYEKNITISKLDKIEQDITNKIETDINSKYEEIKNIIELSKADHVDAMKAEIEKEKQTVEELAVFLKAMITMLKKAAGELDKTEEAYTQQRVQ